MFFAFCVAIRISQVFVSRKMKTTDKLVCALQLSDGTVLQGDSFGAEIPSIDGEIVFTTGMVGYVEQMTDPSFQSQILVFTYPLIGNYGVPDAEDVDPATNLLKYFESNDRIYCAGIVVGEYCESPSHWQLKKTLGQWMAEHNVPGICGVDTRYLTKKIREQGVMLGELIGLI